MSFQTLKSNLYNFFLSFKNQFHINRDTKIAVEINKEKKTLYTNQ